MLFKPAPYDRQKILAAADKARIRGNRKKAIAEYRKVLVKEPDSPEVHAKLGPLLAKTGQVAEAVQSFTSAAEAYREKGFADRAIAVYGQAAQLVPRSPEVWSRIAELHVERGRRADAVKVLSEGARKLGSRKGRAGAIRLLRRVVELDARLLPARLRLAILLAKDGQRGEAVAMLEATTRGLSGPALRRTRGTLLRISPGPGTFWRWLQAALLGR